MSTILSPGGPPVGSPWADDARFEARFRSLYPTNGSPIGPLTATSPHVLDNRPAFDLLSTWIQNGWMNLSPGDGPPAWTTVTTRPWRWRSRFPFLGPSIDSWYVDEEAWPGGLYEIPGPGVNGMYESGSVTGMWNTLVQGRGYWVSVRDHVHILVRESSASPPPLIPYKLGSSTMGAVGLGMAWLQFETALENLQNWAIHLGTHHPSRLSVPYPTFDVLLGGASLIDAVRDWVRGNRGPIYIFEDPGFVAGGATNDFEAHSIILARSAMRGVQRELDILSVAAMSHWARETYAPMLPVPPRVTTGQLHDVAITLARLSGVFAHELMHLVWRNQFGYRNAAWQSEEFGYCWGPPTTSENTLRPHEFLDAAELDALRSYNPNLSPSALHQTAAYVLESPATASPTPLGAPEIQRRASRHYVHYTFQDLIQGLLRNDVKERMDNQDYRWSHPGPDECQDYKDNWP